MKRFLFVSALLFAVADPTNAQQVEFSGASDKPLINDVMQAKIAKHPLTPYLEKSSVVVVDIDISKVDVQETVGWLQQHFRPARDKPLSAEQLAMATEFVESLKSAGVTHLYVTASTRAVFDGGAVAIIPCRDRPAVTTLAAPLVQGMPEKANYIIHVGEDVVVVGPKLTVDRLIASQGVSRPDLVLPLLNDNRSDHVAVISLPPDAKQDLAALWPDHIPNAPALKISPRSLVQDLASVSLGWNLLSEPRLTVKLTTATQQATARIASTITQLLALSPQAAQAIKTTTAADALIIEASPEKMATFIESVAGPARAQANNQMLQNDLKQIGLAMHNYHEVYKHFPPRVLTTPDGKPLLGWRVTILPFLEQQALAEHIKMDQPWDSPQNQQFGLMVIPTFSRYMSGTEQPAKTRIRVPVISGSFWHGEGPPRGLRDIRDGSSNTIAAFIAPESAAVTWTSPEPWVLSEKDPMSDVFGDQEVLNALFFDGSVRTFGRADLDNEKLRAYLTIDGGEKIP